MYEPLLLSWKASQFREITKASQFKAEAEAAEHASLWVLPTWIGRFTVPTQNRSL
ncbi:hypothetical protein L228DRAFT_250680 [Xylona heveae TC161]|uniref:Uncharacterized protein n=1 Tax=Xylona heveae (strain CBS 132557 / TC161) TaxID=1328760 RepID=A0A164ZWU1_XYLHT|nr:hypothetical protein L228DRAFT_250680 [Xylona heveae TC161]KZF19634.1 hypothetical protein L228DRAFT_250680 [Xylona heveae TC161]